MSETQSIKSKAEVKKLTIKFTCPVCDTNDKVVIFSPRFYTDNMVVSVRDKVEYLSERTCRVCYNEMYIKYIRCQL